MERFNTVLIYILCWHAGFAGRISTAVRSDIVELTGIPGVKGYRARVLYKAG